ncbi:MAG: putative transcriptional regulator [Sulfitobacter sp.]|jgi:putative transcriptional regulator
MTSGKLDLTGKLLAAMPGMGDARFDHSVIYLVAHSEEGAMGLIVNKPAAGVSLSDVLEQLDSPAPPSAPSLAVHIGGPVETGRGFVLHSDEYQSAIHTLKIQSGKTQSGFALTATLDVLEDIAQGGGPEQALLMLGYSGWGPGQLEDEISRNGWLTSDAATDLVFNLPDARKWEAVLDTLGIDPLGLSATAGHA